MSQIRVLPDLIEAAELGRWCTRPFCTTCGTHPFRTALRKIPRDTVIAGLRLLSIDFLSKHPDVFHLVISEISFFGIGGELLDSLEGTPAGEQLRTNIACQNRQHEKRKAYLAANTQEVIAARQAQKRSERERSTAPHRERKAASEIVIRAAAQELAETPPALVLELVTRKNFGVHLKALGGLVYERLITHYRSIPIRDDDLHTLSLLAERHSGHWRKLLDQLSS